MHKRAAGQQRARLPTQCRPAPISAVALLPPCTLSRCQGWRGARCAQPSSVSGSSGPFVASALRCVTAARVSASLGALVLFGFPPQVSAAFLRAESPAGSAPAFERLSRSRPIRSAVMMDYVSSRAGSQHILNTSCSRASQVFCIFPISKAPPLKKKKKSAFPFFFFALKEFEAKAICFETSQFVSKHRCGTKSSFTPHLAG